MSWSPYINTASCYIFRCIADANRNDHTVTKFKKAKPTKVKRKKEKA